jgi:hypothetical protein
VPPALPSGDHSTQVEGIGNDGDHWHVSNYAHLPLHTHRLRASALTRSHWHTWGRSGSAPHSAMQCSCSHLQSCLHAPMGRWSARQGVESELRARTSCCVLSKCMLAGPVWQDQRKLCCIARAEQVRSQGWFVQCAVQRMHDSPCVAALGRSRAKTVWLFASLSHP